MQDIADGLGSGVTPKQIETSVELGRQWLNEMKSYNFSEDRQNANDKNTIANELSERYPIKANWLNFS